LRLEVLFLIFFAISQTFLSCASFKRWSY
jgi:hypothetical protein